MVSQVLFSSQKDDWSTPDHIFTALDQEFNFKLDAAASIENAKCPIFITKEQNSLEQDWAKHGPVWVNPPYSRELGKWVEKASRTQSNQTVVMLIPSRTDTKWFHQYIYQKPLVEVRFIKGRLKFGGAKNSAPFPSMVVIFHKK